MAEAVGLSEPGSAGDEPGGGRVTMSLADLAEGVISAAVPGQRELLASVTASWRAGDTRGRRRRGWMGGSVGFGADPWVTSEIIYPLLTGTLAQVLGTASAAGSRRWWRRPKPRHARTAGAMRVDIGADQVGLIRSACISHGITLGLPEPEAALLADALAGVLWRALAGPQVRP
jgi:hypothetical protein